MCRFFLSEESFSSFVSLRELDLSLNWLSNMTFDASDFPHLQVRMRETVVTGTILLLLWLMQYN